MPDTANPHHDLLVNRLPAWATTAHVSHWQKLRQALLGTHSPTATLPDWLANAAPDLREAVEASQARLESSQQALARALKGLRQITEFAEPLLVEHLLDHHQFSAPVRTSEVIHIRQLYTWQTYVSQHERRSLLEAALQNFAQDITFNPQSALVLAGDFQADDTVVIGTTTLGDSDTLVDIELASQTYQIKPLALSVEDFAQACRTLDIGQRYQAHLEALLSPAHVASLSAQAYADQLRLAADIGYLRHHLTGTGRDALQGMLDATTALPCSQLSLFGISLHDVLVIDTGPAGLLLHLPGHAPALQQFDNLGALHDQLASDLLKAPFRETFMAYLPHAQHAIFLDRLQQNLDAAAHSPADHDWLLQEGADLHLQTLAIELPVFTFLHLEHAARLKAEARRVAVPTADADEQERQRRLAEWESLGLNAVMFAGFFIPVVGSLMMAVTAYQLLDEVYEGYQAWSIGDRHLALQHLEAVGLNLALIGGLHVASKLIPKVFNSALMESLDEVPSADGQQRLWRPDLTAYATPLPAELQANALGQYLDGETCYLRLGDHYYMQRLDVASQRWRIAHPTDPDAYQPLLHHNGEGAWWLEHEQPWSWPRTQLLRRLGPRLAAYSDSELEHAAWVSGASDSSLQQVYLEGGPTPVLLIDTLERYQAQRLTLARLANEPEWHAGELFEHIYQGEQAEPLVGRLIEAHPGLSRPLARQVLAALASSERDAVLAGAALPARVSQLATTLERELPLCRALEGVWVPGLASPGSERLTLACLRRMPGWPAQLRVELRGGGPQGPVLDATGDPLAAERCVVIKSSEGYEAYRGERPAPGVRDFNLCRAIVDSLPAPYRQTLGLADSGSQGLTQHLFDLAVNDRQTLALRLRATPEHRWASGALRGGLPPDVVTRALQRRYRRLYPAASNLDYDGEVADWQQQGLTPRAALERLERNQALMRDELRVWAGDSASRQAATANIDKAWRRNTQTRLLNGHTLHSLDLADLNLTHADLQSLALPNAFTHINQLDVSGNPLLSRLPADLYERFPNLQRLKGNHCAFMQLPSVGNPQALEWLELEANHLTWSATAQERLNQFPHLTVLDLSDNPLERAPDLGSLPLLSNVGMRNCRLERLPSGLHVLAEPLALDFSGNPLVRLPDMTYISRGSARALRLDNTGLAPRVEQQVADYYQATGIDLVTPESDYEDLLYAANPAERSAWLRLPLGFRRELLTLLESDEYLEGPADATEQVWRRLIRMDRDPDYRTRAVAHGAATLLGLAE